MSWIRFLKFMLCCEIITLKQYKAAWIALRGYVSVINPVLHKAKVKRHMGMVGHLILSDQRGIKQFASFVAQEEMPPYPSYWKAANELLNVMRTTLQAMPAITVPKQITELNQYLVTVLEIFMLGPRQQIFRDATWMDIT